MSSANAGTDESNSAPKHRACDECRSRKLACSKEADGCARCKREGIACHYSPQKQMGRPRKRPREEPEQASSNDTSAGPTTTTSEGSPNKNPMFSVPPDTEDPGLAFLTFLSGGDTMFDTSLPSGLLDDMALLPPHEDVNMINNNNKGSPNLGQFGYMDMNYGQVDFGDAGIEQTTSLSTSSNLDPALTNMADTPPGSVPNMSSGSSASAESSIDHHSPPMAAHGDDSSNTVGCACTANLYLALDSMQKLSNRVTEGIRQARVAAKTAYQVINCPVCCGASDQMLRSEHAMADSISRSSPRAMQNFQNIMMLGTLIPSIAHAYERILGLVDKEAARAQAERREIPFRMEGYGGLWGQLAADDCCGTTKLLEHRMMEPTIWRLTVRALLRVDVYGITEPASVDKTMNPDSVSVDLFHLGLKDLVIQMENRSRARHAVMDPLLEAGKCGNYSAVLTLHQPGRRRLASASSHWPGRL
ncbi:lactose regulatory protein LAC9 [Apiospora kogelbergensis]|uniref:Lactose regulatory protein LAC9 n=1 Tax=Apiospora kogelbergensis TaxID=1337665 RepID=A0AAW0Q745_9PEZI